MSSSVHAEAETEDVDVWRPTRDEWEEYVKAGLDALGLTYEQLAQQARERNFQSSEAMNFWVVIGGA